ncbi:MAG: hypothetical protein PUP92_00225 [Rhizonema sp. PD38]|nr:hypothetical protein [Rhizonema sp. PD38]
MPCILIVYHAQTSVSYWLYLQAYFESLEEFDLSKIGETYTVHLSKTNTLNEQAIKKFAKYRDDVLKQLQGVIRHNA